jgi:hypothetical protein
MRFAYRVVYLSLRLEGRAIGGLFGVGENYRAELVFRVIKPYILVRLKLRRSFGKNAAPARVMLPVLASRFALVAVA